MSHFKFAPVPSGDTTIASIQDENDQLIAAYNRGQLNIDPNEDQTELIFREGNIPRHVIALHTIVSPAVNGRNASQYIVDELGFFFRSLIANNGGNGESFTLSGVFNTSELLTLALTGSQGTNSSFNIPFARLGQTLIVSPLGDDVFAIRESVRNHFATLEQAVHAAQSGDTILLFGEVAVPNMILLNNKELHLVCMGTKFIDSAVTAMFQLNTANLTLTGNYSINRPNGSLALLQSNAICILEGFGEVNVRSGFSLGTSSQAFVRNGGNLSISTVGNGGVVNTCGDNSELVFDNIVELSCVADNFSNVASNGTITLQNIGSFSFDGLRLCSYTGATGRGEFNLRNIGNAQIMGIGSTRLSSGAIAGTLDAEIIAAKIECNARLIASANAATQGTFTIRDSDITCDIATPIRISGTLICRNSRISAPFASPVIEYDQSGANYNEIVGSRLENSGGHVLSFTGNASSPALNIHNNQFSGGYSDDTQIISSNNAIIEGEEVDVGQTTSSTMVIDFSMGSVFIITLTQDVTLVFENVFKCKNYSLIFLQDNIGFHDVTLPNECKFAGSGLPPSFNYPSAFVVKMQLRLERISDSFHCTFNQFSS